MGELTKTFQLRLFAEGVEGYMAKNQEITSDSEDISDVVTEITHSCANPTLKLLAIEKAEKRSENALPLDENRETEEYKLIIDNLKRQKILRSKKRTVEHKLMETKSNMDKVIEDINKIKERPLTREPRDETRCTELHKRNVGLANILTLLSSVAGEHLSTGRKKSIQELVNKVHAKDYGQSSHN